MGRPRGGEKILRGAEIGLPHGADLAVGVGEAGCPLDGVVAVLRLPHERIVLVPVGGEATARVLHDHDVPVLDEDVDVARAPAEILVVGEPREQHGEAARPVRAIDVGAECHAVARRHGHVLVHQHAGSLLCEEGAGANSTPSW